MTHRPLSVVLRQAARDHLQRTLLDTGGNKAWAADLLGISLATLYRYLQRTRSTPPSPRPKKPKPPLSTSLALELHRKAKRRRMAKKPVLNSSATLGRNTCGLMRYFTGRQFKRRGMSFWHSHRHELEELYYDARQGYLERVRNCHPDRHPDRAGEMREVTENWSVLKDLFRKHAGIG